MSEKTFAKIDDRLGKLEGNQAVLIAEIARINKHLDNDGKERIVRQKQLSIESKRKFVLRIIIIVLLSALTAILVFSDKTMLLTELAKALVEYLR